MHEISIGVNEKDQRLDRFLCKYLNGSTKTNIFKMIRVKAIRVNGKKSKENYILADGDLVTIHVSDESLRSLIRPQKEIPASEVDLSIVYEDEEMLIVCKPQGLLTHPDRSEYQNTLSTAVQLYLRSLCTRTFRPAPVHRLDKNTSGLVIFAKTYDSLKRLTAAMRSRDIEKYYITIVHGSVSGSGDIKGWVVKDNFKNRSDFFQKEAPGSSYVHTSYRALESFGNYTLLEVGLHTGRSHQIRVSLGSIGHPIIGDTKYGGTKVLGQTTQVLHAWRVVVEGRSFEQRSPVIDSLWSRIRSREIDFNS